VTVILGHRGGRGDGWPPENTIDAFTRAFDEGADGLELDARLCGSGEVVVLHDASLERVTGGAERRRVHQIPRAQLPELAGGARIPTLDEALDASRDRIVNVELKADVPSRMGLARACAAAVARARSVDVVFSSFDPFIVLALRALAPRVPRAMLVGQRTPRLATTLPLAMRRAVVAAHLDDALVTPARVQRLVRAGLRVVAWTVNDASRAQMMARWGVSWIITDTPLAIVRAVRASAN
jgi:glycerophosphoryl diester phosphodiesterase